MIYADTDFFVALFKEEDWLKKSASKILSQNISNIRTSSVTIMELFLLSYRMKLDPEKMIVDVYTIAQNVEGMNVETALAASNLMKRHAMTPFDAMHAVYCGDDLIVSSDKTYDKIGITRIPLGKIS